MTQTEQVKICECCGAVIPPTTDGIHFTPSERAVYNFVSRRPGCTMEQIFDHLYWNRSDGGPLTPNTVAVFIVRINNKITGHQIKASHRGVGATYRLVKDAQ